MRVKIELNVQVNTETWASTYGMTTAEAMDDIPEAVRSLVEDGARRNLKLVDAGVSLPMATIKGGAE